MAKPNERSYCLVTGDKQNPNEAMRLRAARLTIIVLTAFTILTIGISVYAYAQPRPVKFSFRNYIAYELMEKPSGYFVLNESHVYAIEAIKKLGQPVEAELSVLNEETFVWEDADGIPDTFLDETHKYGTNKVEYLGKYYRIDVIFGDPLIEIARLPTIRKYAPTAWMVLAISWVGVAIATLYGQTAAKPLTRLILQNDKASSLNKR